MDPVDRRLGVARRLHREDVVVLVLEVTGAIVTTVAVSRTDDYLAAHTDADPLVALTEGFQSAFLAVAILAAIGVALALLFLGRHGVPQEQLGVEPSSAPASD
jgi:ABC-type sulfate transport system permease component